jgi:ferrous iron transport protein A
MPLSYLAPGENGHVLGLRGDPESRQHLLEMGCTVGTPVDFLRIAPLGDPITVRIRGYHLSLRRQEADAIWMRRCPPEMAYEDAHAYLTGDAALPESRRTSGGDHRGA